MNVADRLRTTARAIRADAEERAGALEAAADELDRGADDVIPVAKVAETLGVRERVVLDAGRRGEVRIEGPRAARVIRRSELDRWLGARGVTQRDTKTENEPQRDATTAVQRAAARWGSK